MTISVTNGTLTRLSETLSPSTGKLPDTVTVSGATSSYNTSTGALELTSLTDTVSITAAEIAPTVAFDLDSLGLAAGNYTITVRSKGTGYRDSEASNSVTYTVLEQLSTPSNLSVSGTNVTMDEVANATSYEFYANGVSIGEYSPASLISFSITLNSVAATYQAEDGMTWGEWVASEYNTDNYTVFGGTSITHSNAPSGYVVTLNGTDVSTSNTIIASASYVIMGGGE